VIRFDDERMHLAQPFHDYFGHVTKIGDKANAAQARVKCEADWIDCVVRYGKSLHRDVTDLEFRAGAKDLPVGMMIERAVIPNGFGGLGVRVNWKIEFPAKNLQATNVVAVFMGEKNTVELFGIRAALLESKNDLSCAQPAIDQNFTMIGRDERAVAGTAAPERRQTEHAGI